MTIRIRRNFGPLNRLSMVGSKDMREIGLLVQRMVRTRTQAGKDATGAAFRPLSPAYAAQKREALGSAEANLTVSGRMLQELKITSTTRNAVSVGYTAAGGGRGSGTFIQRSRAVSGAAKALYHNELGAGRSRVKREFLGLTPAEEREIEGVIAAAVARNVVSTGGK